MKKFNLLRKSERKSVGTTLALTVGSPSAHRRYSALKHLTFMLLFLLGSLNVWGADVTCTLSNANIVAGGAGASGYGAKSMTDGCGQTWNAYAIKNQHSNATSDYHYLQIRKYSSPTAYYLQVPEKSGYTIKSITMVVSGSSQPRTGGGNSATLYFSASNSTSAGGTGVVSGTGASSVTIDCSSLELATGYITAGGAIRIWGDVVVTYTPASSSCDKKVNISAGTTTNGTFDLSKTGETATCDAAVEVTVTPHPSEHFEVDEVTASNGGSVSGPDGEGKYTVTYAKDDNYSSEINVTFKETTQYTVTWNNHGLTSTSQVYEGEKPEFPATPTSCDATSTTFIGWATAAWNGKVGNIDDKTVYTSAAEMPAVAGLVEYFAVYAKASAGDEEEHDGPSFSRSGSDDTYTTGYTFSAQAEGKTGYYQDGSGTLRYIQVLNATTPIFSETPNRVTVTAKIGGGTGDTDLTDPVQAQLLDKTGAPITGAVVAITSHITTNTGDTYAEIEIPITGVTSAYGVRISHKKQSGYNVRYYSFSLKYYTGGATYSDYMTTCAAAGTCEAPSFSPAAGTFDGAQDIVLQSSTPSSHIYYTLDGTDPDDNSDEYSTPIHITQNTTIKAITYADGLTESSISTGKFNIRYAQPTFSPAGGAYNAAQNVTISATGADAIYYTTNGEDPIVDPANLYDGNAIEINTTGSHTIKAIAVKAGYANSNVASATYVMDLPYGSIAEFIAGTPTTAKSLTLNNAIITGVDGTTLYIQDETAGIMIYGLTSLPENAAPNHSISGTIVGKYSLYKNQHELVKPNNATPIDITNVTVSADPVSRPDISSYATLEAAYAAKPMMLVKLTDVRYDGTQYEFSGNKIYNTFGALTDKTMPETTVDCDITGVVINYNGTLELLPVFASDIVADADAAAPTFTPAGGATEGEAVQVDLNSYVSIAPADANHSVDITSAQITTTDPMSVTAVSSRDFYRNTSVTKWYYGNSASASYDINGQGSTAQGTIVAKVNDEIAASAKENDEVHVFITPNTHFHFATILVNDGAITTTEVSEGAEYSFEMPDEAVTIAVTWNEDAKVNVQFAKGKEAATGDVPSTMSNKYENDVITLPANPFTLTSWKFKGWKHSLTDAIHQPGSYTITAADVAEDAITFAAEWEAMPDFAGGDWMLVTDVAELTEGSYVIIASADVDEAMKPYVSGSNCKTAEATIDNGLLTYNNVFAVYEIREGKKENTFALQDISSDYYLYAASSSSNDMKTEETLTDNSSWTASITSTGDATLVAQGSNTRNVMHYNPNGTNPSVFSCYASTSTVTGLVTLYKYHVPSLKLTYDKNAGDDVVTGMPSMGIADGENKVTISDATPLREGYLFDGWNSNPLGGGTVYEANHEYTLTANLTIYAQWQTATAHSLSYEKNGGEGDVPDATNYYPNADVTLADAVTKEGYLFAGWEYDGNVYAAGSHFAMPNEDVVMTAKFAQGAVYTITSRESVSEQGAPEGSSASFENTYTENKYQMTKDNSMTLTLSGYNLYTIKALTLRMRSNSSSGKGTLSVTIGGEAVIFTTNKWYDGGHHTDSYEDIQVSLTPTRVMPGENVVIEIAASQKSLYCQSFAIEYELVLDELRGGLTEGKWGTYCPDKEVKHPAGASFYTLTYMELNPDGSPYKFFFDEIAENASLAAGKPYLFIAEGDAIMGVKVGDAADAGDHANNGFVGYLGAGKHITSDYNTYTAGATNYYGLQNNIFKLIYSTSSTENILNERAYVEISPSRQPSTTQVSMPAPGRRRLSVGAGAPQSATGLEDGELMNDGMVKKVLINGELFIIRGEKMYDATGRIVK